MEILVTFEPSEIRRLGHCDLTVTLVNDSEFFLSFLFSGLTGEKGRLLHSGVLEPETCLDLEKVSPMGISRWESFLFQCLLWRKDGSFPLTEPVSLKKKVAKENFLKEGLFRNPLYSDRPALEIPLVKDCRGVEDLTADPELLRDRMSGGAHLPLEDLVAKYRRDTGTRGERAGSRYAHKELNPHKVLDPMEVDLHIHQLVDTTVGLDNTAMLMLQLDTVRRTMKEHKRRKGQHITFIHGNGDGVLRRAMRDLLRREFPGCEVEDASFRRYGFGATLVIVR